MGNRCGAFAYSFLASVAYRFQTSGMKITSRICLILLCFGMSALAADQSVGLKAARMFDGKSNALVQNAVVIVQGDKIVDAGSNLPIPSGAQVVALGDA